MSSKLASFFIVVMVMGFSFGLEAQDAPSNTETRLRDALRDTTLQLRDAQNQGVTLQAAKDQADKEYVNKLYKGVKSKKGSKDQKQ